MEQEFNVYKKLSEYTEVNMVHLLVGSNFVFSRLNPFGTWERTSKMLPRFLARTKEVLWPLSGSRSSNRIA